MNSFMRGLAVVLFSLGLFGFSGCAEDNEASAKKAPDLGDPGKRSDTEKNAEPVKLSNDPVKRHQQQGDPRNAMGKDYPIQGKR